MIVSETESTFIKNLHSLESSIPVGLLYKKISKGLIKIYNNPKKLDTPFEERTSCKRAWKKCRILLANRVYFGISRLFWYPTTKSVIFRFPLHRSVR